MRPSDVGAPRPAPQPPYPAAVDVRRRYSAGSMTTERREAAGEPKVSSRSPSSIDLADVAQRLERLDAQGRGVAVALDPPGGAGEAVDEHERAAADDAEPVAVREHARAVVVAEQDVVEPRQEARRGGLSPVATGASGRSSSSRPRSSAKTRSPRAQALDDRGEARQPRPEPHVGHARRPERGEVAQDQRVRRGLLRQRAAGQLSAPAPTTARPPLARARSRAAAAGRAARRSAPRRRAPSGRAPGQRSASARPSEAVVPGVSARTARPAATTSPTSAPSSCLADGLPAKRFSSIAWCIGRQARKSRGGRQVQRGAHQRRAQHLVRLEQRDQLRGLEALQPRPQAVERRGRLLALHAGEVLDRLARRAAARGAAAAGARAGCG